MIARFGRHALPVGPRGRAAALFDFSVQSGLSGRGGVWRAGKRRGKGDRGGPGSAAAVCIYVMARSLVGCPHSAQPRMALCGGGGAGIPAPLIYVHKIPPKCSRNIKTI